MRDWDAEPALPQRPPKDSDILLGEFLRPPLVRALGEKLHGIAAVSLGREQSIVMTTGNRHVRAEERHDSPQRHKGHKEKPNPETQLLSAFY